MEFIEKDVYTKNTILEKLKTLDNLSEKEYDDLYNDVIQVGEILKIKCT